MLDDLKLGDDQAFGQAQSLLKTWAHTNKVRTPTLSLLLALLYYQRGNGHRPVVPFIGDREASIRRKDLELAADELFHKTIAPDARRPILMLFTGNWLKASSNPDQNTWRNPMDTQTGLRCNASVDELRVLDYVTQDRSECRHRDPNSRTCGLRGESSDAHCHNPTKNSAAGPTLVPSLPKVLALDDTGFRLVSLSPEVLEMALGAATEKIPLFPFLYVLYYGSTQLGRRTSVGVDELVADFGLTEARLSALFDSSPQSALNRTFLEALEARGLVEARIICHTPSADQATSIQNLVDRLIGLQITVDGHGFVIGSTPHGYALHNDGLRISFDVVSASGLIVGEAEGLDEAQRVLWIILRSSAEIRRAFGLPEAPGNDVLLSYGGDAYPGAIDEALAQIEREAEAELDKVATAGSLDLQAILARATEGWASTKVRLGQDWLRKKTLENYEHRCALCTMALDGMLVTSHVIPWQHEACIRLDPHNAICLCSLHDKAFELGLITFQDGDPAGKHQIELSQELLEWLAEAEEYRYLFDSEMVLRAPLQWPPKSEFLKYHRQAKFRG